jgi:hypothetical protein
MGGLPELIDAEKCFRPAVPSYQDIWVAAFRACNTDRYDISVHDDAIKLSKSTESRRRELYCISLLHATISEEKQLGVKVFNVFSHALRQRMQLPTGYLTSTLEQNGAIAINITPPGSFTDLHHGNYDFIFFNFIIFTNQCN